MSTGLIEYPVGLWQCLALVIQKHKCVSLIATHLPTCWNSGQVIYCDLNLEIYKILPNSRSNCPYNLIIDF